MQRKVLKTLPARTYSALYRLAVTVKLHGLSSTDVIVKEDIRHIVETSPVKDDFIGWSDKKLARWFFDHFLRVNARSSASRKRRDALIEANERLVQLEEESMRIQRDNLFQHALQQATMVGLLNQQMLLAQNAQYMEGLLRSGQIKLEVPDQGLTQPGVSDPDSNAQALDNELEEIKDHSSES